MRAMPLPVIKDQLPIVQEEVEDTRIHGSASDPHKLAEYRALLRLRNRWLEQERFDVDSGEHIDTISC
jgi:hypothetical protein